MMTQLFLAVLLTPIFGVIAETAFAVSQPLLLEQLRNHTNIVPVVVIGGGYAGLSAALHTVRAGFHTVVIRGHEPGGQLMGSTRVENIIATDAAPGYKIMDAIEQRVTSFGVEFLDDTVIAIEKDEQGCFIVTTEQGNRLYALTIIAATGATPRLLGVPGEQQYLNNGIYTCATCDCRQALDKDIIVVGGGDSSIEAIMILATYAKSITFLVRGPQLRAGLPAQRALQKYPVTTLYSTKITEFIGDDDGLQAVRIVHAQTHEEKVIPASCVFLSIGHQTNSALFTSLITLDADGYPVMEGRTQRTSCPGIFAAGDLVDPMYRLADPAAGDAAKAAFDLRLYLHNQRLFSQEMARELEPNYFHPAV